MAAHSSLFPSQKGKKKIYQINYQINYNLSDCRGTSSVNNCFQATYVLSQSLHFGVYGLTEDVTLSMFVDTSPHSVLGRLTFPGRHFPLQNFAGVHGIFKQIITTNNKKHYRSTFVVHYRERTADHLEWVFNTCAASRSRTVPEYCTAFHFWKQISGLG